MSEAKEKEMTQAESKNDSDSTMSAAAATSKVSTAAAVQFNDETVVSEDGSEHDSEVEEIGPPPFSKAESPLPTDDTRPRIALPEIRKLIKKAETRKRAGVGRGLNNSLYVPQDIREKKITCLRLRQYSELCDAKHKRVVFLHDKFPTLDKIIAQNDKITNKLNELIKKRDPDLVLMPDGKAVMRTAAMPPPKRRRGIRESQGSDSSKDTSMTDQSSAQVTEPTESIASTEIGFATEFDSDQTFGAKRNRAIGGQSSLSRKKYDELTARYADYSVNDDWRHTKEETKDESGTATASASATASAAITATDPGIESTSASATASASSTTGDVEMKESDAFLKSGIKDEHYAMLATYLDAPMIWDCQRFAIDETKYSELIKLSDDRLTQVAERAKRVNQTLNSMLRAWRYVESLPIADDTSHVVIAGPFRAKSHGGRNRRDYEAQGIFRALCTYNPRIDGGKTIDITGNFAGRIRSFGQIWDTMKGIAKYRFFLDAHALNNFYFAFQLNKQHWDEFNGNETYIRSWNTQKFHPNTLATIDAIDTTRVFLLRKGELPGKDPWVGRYDYGFGYGSETKAKYLTDYMRTQRSPTTEGGTIIKYVIAIEATSYGVRDKQTLKDWWKQLFGYDTEPLNCFYMAYLKASQVDPEWSRTLSEEQLRHKEEHGYVNRDYSAAVDPTDDGLYKDDLEQEIQYVRTKIDMPSEFEDFDTWLILCQNRTDMELACTLGASMTTTTSGTVEDDTYPVRVASRKERDFMATQLTLQEKGGCGRCVTIRHNSLNCPRKGKACLHCGEMGHHFKMCRHLAFSAGKRCFLCKGKHESGNANCPVFQLPEAPAEEPLTREQREMMPMPKPKHTYARSSRSDTRQSARTTFRSGRRGGHSPMISSRADHPSMSASPAPVTPDSPSKRLTLSEKMQLARQHYNEKKH